MESVFVRFAKAHVSLQEVRQELAALRIKLEVAKREFQEAEQEMETQLRQDNYPVRYRPRKEDVG